MVATFGEMQGFGCREFAMMSKRDSLQPMSQIAYSNPEMEKARLRVDDFWLLKQSGAFAGYAKAELLDGELWGVIRAPDDCGQWDHMVPIMLRPIDHDLLREGGTFEGYETSEIHDGMIWVNKSQLSA